MSAKSDYTEQRTLQFWLTATAVTKPTSWSISLGTSSGTDNFTELTETNGYLNKRSITFGAPQAVNSGPAAGTWEALNDVSVSFGPSSGGGWNGNAAITHFCVYGSSDGGSTWNPLYMGALDASRTVTASNETITIAQNALKIREA